MVKHPDLIQRPIVEKGARAILARPADRLKEIMHVLGAPDREAPGEGRDCGDEFSGIDRLGQMNLEAGPERLHPIRRPRVSGQRRGRKLADTGIGMPSDALDEVVAVLDRHSQIRDEDIGHVAFETGQALPVSTACCSTRGAGGNPLRSAPERITLVVHGKHMDAAEIAADRKSLPAGRLDLSKLATGLLARWLQDHQWKPEPERRALIDAAAGGLDRAAVHLRELMRNGKGEARARLSLSPGAGVGLAEALEHVRQERRGDADAGVGDHDSTWPRRR